MLQNKNTTIISELSDFFTTSEKAINTILTITRSLKLSDRQIEFESKCNNEFRNIDKLIILLLFPFFDVSTVWMHTNSMLYPVFSCSKDVFYRLLNNSFVQWRKLSYTIFSRLQKQIELKGSNNQDDKPKCLIIDDTDLPKTGMKIELIGKVFSHVTQKSLLAFKGLFMGYHDGTSFFALDFSLHGEKGKNKKKPYGLTKKQLKARFSKNREKSSIAYLRKEEYSKSKIEQMIVMLKQAIIRGIKFDYILVDSWFTCFELIKLVNSKKSKHLIGMTKMGKTNYLFEGEKSNAKQIIDIQRRKKRIKRSRAIKCQYSEVVVDFNGITVKLFFCKTSRKGKWHLLLTTNQSLNFQEAYKIYSTRWSIEVFFKESKQYLGLGKCQSQDFDAQIASTTICMIQFNILSVAKRFADYESLGELFRGTKAETLQLTMNERIWLIIIEILSELAEIFELDTESLLEKIISDNEKLTKISNYTSLLQAG
ncbi:MAG: transposase [Bacteroidota bacterium]